MGDSDYSTVTMGTEDNNRLRNNNNDFDNLDNLGNLGNLGNLDGFTNLGGINTLVTPEMDFLSSPLINSNLGIQENNNNDNTNNNNNNNNSIEKSQGNIQSEEELYQRRKAQNRAAQRAFRERKEGKLKELSSKLQDAELARLKLEKQLNDLKQKNIVLDMENQLLQRQQQQRQEFLNESTNSLVSKSPCTDNTSISELGVSKILSYKFPKTSKTDFIDGSISWEKHGQDNSQAENLAGEIGHSYEFENEKVLTISAVWDYLVEFTNLNDEYSLDIPGIMDGLRGKEKCHGFGPAYPIGLVNDIISRHIEKDED